MKHIRTQIREHVAALLAGRAPLAAVYSSRRAPVSGESLPAATVMLGDEEATSGSMGVNGIQERAALLQIEVRAKARDRVDPEQQFDAIADACALVIEQAMAESALLGGLAKFLLYRGTETEYSDDQPEGTVTLTWEVRYHTRAQHPEQSV